MESIKLQTNVNDRWINGIKPKINQLIDGHNDQDEFNCENLNALKTFRKKLKVLQLKNVELEKKLNDQTRANRIFASSIKKLLNLNYFYVDEITKLNLRVDKIETITDKMSKLKLN